ncbi:MAG: response regulator transcription factor [Zoogloeaceae bacterium]|nr:response regulator transcription factor [Zoogloeaceae bacterium]
MSPNPIMSAQVLVLEDEPEVARLICASLADYGLQAETVPTGRELLKRAQRSAPDLCLIDLGLPDMDGLQVLKELQEHAPCAVMILTGRNDVSDRVLGLELGADDYLVKPFEPRELVARARSILRRYQRGASDAPVTVSPGVAHFNGWTFDPGRHHLLTPAGEEVGLSAAEAALLHTLLRRPNRILTREQLLGERDVDPFDRSIDVRISRLRRKLDDDPQNPRLIKTVYGAGYLFTAGVTWG